MPVDGTGKRGKGKLVPPTVEDDVERELAFHLDMRQAELEAEGWDAGEARREALRQFGDRDRAREECMSIETSQRRSRARANFLEGLLQDVRFAVRTLGRSPGFTAVALLTLALGIGINTAVFSVVNGVLLRPLDHPESDRIVRVDELSETGVVNAVAWPNFVDWRADSRTLSGMAAYGAAGATLQGDGAAERVVVARVTEDFFRVMRVTPIRGRTFGEGEGSGGAGPVAVISHGLWQRMFGGVETLDGLTLRSGAAGIPVIGVLPQGFDFPSGSEAWIPVDPSLDSGSRTAHNWRVVARLADGVSLTQASDEVNALAVRLQQLHAGDINAHGARAVPLQETMVGDVRRPLLLLLGAAGLVLLVACCNLASTLLARAATRRREVAIRSSLGAGRGRVVQQFLTESLVLTLAGAVLGLVLAMGLLQLLLALAPPNLPRISGVSIDLPVLLFTLGISVATALLFGLFPAIQSSREDLRDAMDQGGRGGAGGRRPLVWDLLVGAEVALALVLLVGSGLLVRSFVGLTAVDPGFEAEGVLAVAMTLPSTAPGEDVVAGERGALARWERVLPELSALPGVTSVGVANVLPFSGQGANGTWIGATAMPSLDGIDPDDLEALMRLFPQAMEQIRTGSPGSGGDAGYRVVGGEYFAAMGIPLLEGRTFLPSDHYDAPHVAVINETMARRHWPGESAVGKHFFTGGMDRFAFYSTEIVGVVADVRHFGPASEPRPEYFVSMMQRPGRSGSVSLVVRGRGDPALLTPAVRARLGELAPEVPLSFATMEEQVSRFTGRERFSVLVFGAFAVLALILAAVGIYGVVSYAVARRTREMGIRIALGATPAGVRRLVMRGSLVAVVAGAVVGLVASLNLGRFMEGLLHQVSPRDPGTLLVVTLLILAAAWLATFVPARRGTRVDPMVTMRGD